MTPEWNNLSKTVIMRGNNPCFLEEISKHYLYIIPVTPFYLEHCVTALTTVEIVVIVLLFYVHGKHLRSCRDGQLT